VDVVTPPPPGVKHRPLPLAAAATVLAVLIAGWWSVRVAVEDNHHEDLWIYTAAARLAFDGTSPYSTARIHAAVAEQYPDADDLLHNAAYLRPPATLPVFAPYFLMDWTTAKVVWCLTTVLLAALSAWHLSAFTSAALPPWFTAAAAVAVLCNPLTLFVLIVGQTPLLFVACVVLGQAAHVRGRRRIGAALWALAFVKPHIALPLLPLAWYLSGWRRAAEIAVYAGLMNVAAGVVTVGNPLLVLDWLAYLPEGHKSVEFNLVSVNKQITSWNRLVVAFGGPAIELGLAGTLTGYAVWFGLVWVRYRTSSPRPTGAKSPAWALAVSVCGALVCCQSLPYELPMLVLVLPYLGELFTSGRGRDQAAALLIAGFAAFAMMPGGEGGMAENFATDVGGFVDRLGKRIGIPWNVTHVLTSHRSLGVMCVSAVVMVRGAVGGRVGFVSSPRQQGANRWSALADAAG